MVPLYKKENSIAILQEGEQRRSSKSAGTFLAMTTMTAIITADGAYHCPVGSIMAIFFQYVQA